jgi:hypothetical protein
MRLLVSTLVGGLLLGGIGLGAAPAAAQTLNIGPGGVTVDPRSPRERAMDREIRREERYRAQERRERYERRRDHRAGRGCRTVTETRDTPRGQVRRTTRVCD